MFEKTLHNSSVSKFDALCMKLKDHTVKHRSGGTTHDYDVSVLSDIVLDILSLELNENEKVMASGLLLEMMQKAEKDLKISLAARLLDKDDLPFELIIYLANDDIDVAAPIIKNSPCFSDMDLMYLIHARDSVYWQAIAQRHNLSAQTIQALVDKKDIPTAKNLLKNNSIELKQDVLEGFCDLSKHDSILADLIALRPEATKEIFERICDIMSVHIKAKLERKFSLPENVIDMELNAARKDVVDLMLGNIEVTAQMQNLAERLNETGNLNRSRILKALNHGHTGTFIAFLSAYLNLNVEQVHESLRQPCGKAIAVIAKAADFSKNEFLTVYALTKCMRVSHSHDGHSVSLSNALKYFDRVNKQAAQRMIRQQTTI